MAEYVSVDQHGLIFGTHSVVNADEVQAQVSALGAYAMIEVDPSLLEMGSIPSNKYYFDGQGLAIRPQYVENDSYEILANGEDTLVFDNLPDGLPVIYRHGSDTQSLEVEGGNIEFVTSEVGEYTFLFLPPHPSLYRPQLVKVNAHD